LVASSHSSRFGHPPPAAHFLDKRRISWLIWLPMARVTSLRYQIVLLTVVSNIEFATELV
jgi:hypothetical protein